MNSIDSQIPQMPEVRIARLEEELDEARAEVEKEKLAAKAWEATAEANYVEVEQLRAALKLCVEIVEDEYDGCSPPAALVAARAALAAVKGREAVNSTAANPYGFAR